MFKPIQAVLSTAGQAESAPSDAGIKRVFMVLHGFYGNLFLSKFATGSLGDDGDDQGIANARRVWGYALRDYDTETVKLALGRLRAAHPEFPPSLPQFQALCDAAKPRPVYRPAPLAPALAMSEELRAKRRAQARIAATEAAHRRMESLRPVGLDALKRAIADAVSCAGGDEVATLLRLDRDLAPRAAQ